MVHDQTLCANSLNADLLRINEWAQQWKLSFNPDPLKSATEVYFSRRNNLPYVPSLIFNNTVITSLDFQKHLGLVLDNKLSFDVHLSEKVNKANKLIGLIKRLRSKVPRHTLLDIYRAFIRPHLDYGDIIYDNPGCSNFSQRLESIQYNAALAITGCIQGTSREKLYNELGLESLSDRRYCRKLCFFYKIINGYAPAYLKRILPEQPIISYSFRSRNSVPCIATRTERFRNSYFPFCLREWNKLDCHIRELPSISSFKNALFRFFRPNSRPVYRANDYYGVVLLTRLRVGFSHLKEHKFRHNFLDTTDPFCSCRTNEIEDTSHYLLHCPNYSNERATPFNDLSNPDISIIPLRAKVLCDLILHGSQHI